MSLTSYQAAPPRVISMSIERMKSNRKYQDLLVVFDLNETINFPAAFKRRGTRTFDRIYHGGKFTVTVLEQV